MTVYCRDCEYAYALAGAFNGFEYARCYHPEVTKKDIIGGEGQFCKFERDMGGSCGLDGKLFEQKKPWWKKLFRAN